ncbi:MAG: cell division protein FtsZ [Nevskiales bacterium]|nr:cell division protein FtsZ [Nevskiales bacterium]
MGEIFEVTDGKSDRAIIRVIGVGGGGCNTVNQMVETGIDGVDFVCANTDRQHLERCKTTAILQLGAAVTRGLGAGSNPEVGRQAALEDKDRIRELIEHTDLLFITAGMGGGTGTGGAPVIAEIAKELGILTVAVVTKPFVFEQKKRMNAALKGIEEMERFVDSLILIPNEKLLLVLGEDAEAEACFKAANDVLQNAVQGISDLITRPGQINVDFADVRTVMLNRGKAMMGMGAATGEDRAVRAAEAALSSPLLDDLELSNARGILLNIACDKSLKMGEIRRINDRVMQIAHEDADVKFGTSLDPGLNGELRVSVVATGLGGAHAAAGTNPVVTSITTAQSKRTANLDEPAIHRAKPRAVPDPIRELVYDENLLDIPAFLRAQAD